MSDLEDVTRLPSDFDGHVRLFPLPELVVFPHAMQPLHIFEPRYCDLLQESLATDKLIAMATLTTGVCDLLLPKPTIAATVCIGKIMSHVETEDGRHNILLIGAKRARVVCELESNRTFRMAEVEVQGDLHPAVDPQERKLLRASLLAAFAAVIPSSATMQQNLQELMASQMGLGPITDILSFTLGLTSEAKLRLLAEVDVDRRARMLIQFLQQISAGGLTATLTATPAVKSPASDFPPPFSRN
jgi:uncharacterized protein